MTFFYAFSVAGFLGLGFGALAFRYARTICVQLLVFWVYFVALPLATAWLYTGNVTNRALIGQDLYSIDLAAALVAHAHLYLLYGLGVFGIAFLFRDAKIVEDMRRTLAAQEFRMAWPVLFVAAVLAGMLIKLRYETLIVGSGDAERVAAIPYVVYSIVSLLGTLIFGLYCYVAVLSARSRWLFFLCLAYVPYVLATEGRRAMLSALIALFVLRGLSLGFRLNQRLFLIAAGALTLFILIGPFFIAARGITLTLQERGYPPFEALTEGVSQAVEAFANGETGFARVATNVAERGNAGVFFLTAVERAPEKQLGAMTWYSIIWAMPSAFVEKPPLQVEAMIQLLVNMRLLDDANSVPLLLYVDFGALGMILAGALTALLLYAVAKFLSRSGQFGVFHVALLGVFFTLSFSVETELSGYFVAFRNVALFLPFTLLAAFFAQASGRGGARQAPPAPIRLQATASARYVDLRRSG